MLALLLTCPVNAVVITQAPGNFVLDGVIDEWIGQPLAFRIGGDNNSSIWLARTGTGLVLAGAVNRKFPFARTQAELASGGALEIALSFVDAVNFPDLPYDAANCPKAPNESAQAACTAWFKRQEIYRNSLERQFTRIWRVAPAGS